MRLLVSILAVILLVTNRASADLCIGDCDSTGEVTVDELVKSVNVALGTQPLDVCAAIDINQDGMATVDELVRAVRSALDGCSSPTVTETPPSSSSPTILQTATPTLAPTSPTETPAPTDTESPAPTASVTDSPTPLVSGQRFCDLPGSVRTTAEGITVVPGGPNGTQDLRFLKLPVGFCAHVYAKVGNARQLRFAPNGDLFVASPTTYTTSNPPNGLASIVVVPDDDGDGVGDENKIFLSGLPATQGLMFAHGYLYYQNHTRIMRTPYMPGDRIASGPGDEVANITIHSSALHWPKTLDIADDGTIYVSNGGDQGDPCQGGQFPFRGGILALDGTPGGRVVARGFRNPISVRCTRGHNMCFAVELAKDYTAAVGGREKLVPIRDGDDWGFPCCATKDVPYPGISPVPNCAGVATDYNSFVIAETPFDVDFETGKWPEPWNNRAYIPLHGAFGTWTGARVLAISLDPITGQLLPGSTLPGPSGALSEFADGWNDGPRCGSSPYCHGRPANVAFAPDGRLFLGNDTLGEIIWIAPFELTAD